MNQSPNSSSTNDQKTGKPLPVRRSRMIFVLVILVTSLAVIWPGHAIFSSATPLILGFPLSFAWIIFWVIVGFLAMLGLYLSDSHDDDLKPEHD